MGVGERWHNGAGSLPDLGYPVTPMLARILARAVEGTDFRASRSGGGSEPAAAHSLMGEWPRAMARRRRLLPDLRISAPPVLARILAWAVDRDRFSTHREAAAGGAYAMPAHGLGEWPRAIARWRDGAGCCRTSGFRPPRSLHAYWRCGDCDRFSTIDKRGRRCLREPAHGLRE